MSYRALARTVSPGFFPLGFFARLPYATAPLGTLILLDSTTGSYAFAGVASAAQNIAFALGALVLGPLADRYGPRSVGSVAALANAAALLWLIAISHGAHAEILVAATMAGLTQPPIGSLVRVGWSRLLGGGDQAALLATALSYESAADEISFVTGSAAVGLLTPISTSLGPVAPLLVTVALLLGATLPFALRHGGPRPARPTLASAPSAPLPWRRLGLLVLAMAAIGVVFGAVQTGVSVYANNSGAPGLAGLLYAELSLGSALTGAACAWLPSRFTPRWRYLSFTGTLLLGTSALLAGGSVLPVPVAMAIASVTVAPYMISLYALTDRLAPPQRASVAMTVLSAGGPLGTATGRAVAGFLAQHQGSAGAFAVAPGAAAAALVLALVVVRMHR